MNASSTYRKALVIVGNGMVAGRLLDELLKRDASKFRITVIGEEPHGCYNRIMLSSVLAKDTSVASIVQKDHDWYTTQGITFLSGTRVIAINNVKKCVETNDGRHIDYDELVLATGSRAASIPAKNALLENIFYFRTIADTHAMMDLAKTARKVLVVGGGLLGLEAAYGLAKFGARVTLVHRSAWLMNRQLDSVSADMLQASMSELGIEFKLQNEALTFHGDKGVQAVTLKTGETLDIDMAVIATGISPNAELGNNIGLLGNRAIVVDDFMQTRDTSISALGECIEHNGLTFGLVDPLWRQAETLAARLASEEPKPFLNLPLATKLKVSGVQLYSAGEVQERPGLRSLCIEDPEARVYRKLLIEDGHIKGIVLFGDVRSGQFYFDLMQQQRDISHLLPNLIFGEEFISESPADELVA